jgi:hypothetical protein
MFPVRIESTIAETALDTGNSQVSHSREKDRLTNQGILVYFSFV